MLTVEDDRSLLRRRAGAARVSLRRRSRARSPACSAATASARHRCCARSSASMPIARGAIAGTAQDITTLPPYDRAPARHRLRAAGPRDLSAAHGAREPRDRLRRRCTRAERTIAGRDLRSVPGAEGHAAAGAAATFPAASSSSSRSRRALVTRPAPAGARRADRGHPALDHQGHRPRDRLSARARATWRSAGRAIFRIRPRPRRPISP